MKNRVTVTLPEHLAATAPTEATINTLILQAPPCETLPKARGDKTTRIAYHVDNDALDALNAKRGHRTRSEYIRRIIQRWHDEQEETP